LAFIVTARKWRPQRFDEVIGQDHITRTLKNAIKKNRIGHAYLFAGPRGVGKTTTARILAKTLNCLNPVDSEPCNECEMCKKFDSSQTLDIIEIDGASNRRIEEIRTLRESVKYAPTVGNYKVYIIDEVHMLTTESFNALLKTLEEPPEHTIFIFATTDVHKVPLTIVSRCQRFDFRRIELKEIKSVLKKIADAEGIKIDDESLTIIAKKADGALRDAESIFDQVVSFSGNEISADIIKKMMNLIDEEIYFKISDALLGKDYSAAFDITEEIYSKGWNYIDFINGLVEHFRNILSVVIKKNNSLIEASESTKEKYLEYKTEFGEGDLLRILNFLNKVQYEIKQTQNVKLKVEISLFHLIGLEKSSTITQILEELKKKDNRISSQSVNQTKATEKPSGTKISGKAKNITVKETISLESPTIEKTLNKSELDFNTIAQHWEKLINTVTQEKFILGGILSSVKPVGFSNNVIKVTVEHEDDISILKEECNYLHQKTNEVFGTKLKFDFSKDSGITSAWGKAEPTSGKNGIETSNEDDLYVKEILEKFGGREIK